MEILQSSRKMASTASYLAAVLFAILIVLFNVDPQMIVPIAIVGVAFHVVLFPVVSSLPSTDWAMAAAQFAGRSSEGSMHCR